MTYLILFFKFLLFMGRSTVLYPLAAFLLIVFYFVWAHAHAQLRLIKGLKAELGDISVEKTILLQDLDEQIKWSRI